MEPHVHHVALGVPGELARYGGMSRYIQTPEGTHSLLVWLVI